ncbi:MAG: hypothetical protein K8R73_03950 [Clostridiales bacterium]|nr:hypothetical protein [Clostridiales bacterium]
MKIFDGKQVVFLTKHGKESVVKPLFEDHTGCHVIVNREFDTDKFGTFSRERKRRRTQLKTARKKIKVGLKRSNADLGIASEGSFGFHPQLLVPWNVEMLLFYDQKDKFEILGIYEGPLTNFSHRITSDYKEIVEFATKVGFPEHQLIMRPDHEKHKFIIKDIDDSIKLKAAFERCMNRSKAGRVYVETDMRAHANPTRMCNIEKATQDLVDKLMKLCPMCSAPGFIAKEEVKGLPCSRCGTPSEFTEKIVYECHKCRHKEEHFYPHGRFVPAEYCQVCNP